MKKIIIIGCPGSGKSTFARALRDRTGLPLYHLDMLYWNADKTNVDKSVFLERLSEVLRQDEWIIDGNYGSTMELRLSACDTAIFLDYPTEVCLDGIRSRMGQPRSDIPWVETQQDGDFFEFVKHFNEQQRPAVLALLAAYRDKRTVTLTSREQADDFLLEISNKNRADTD